jgi:prepilin-type N-terminal cleavage/methylation domain-containing protein/prepilin-type processing-associated H-X9-DG protein
MKVDFEPGWSALETGKMSKENPARSAFTLTELVVVLAVISLLTFMLLRSQASTRADAQRLQCISNLKQIGLAFRIWGASHADQYPMQVSRASGGAMPTTGWTRSPGGTDGNFTYTVFQVMSNELSKPKVVVCPADDRFAATNFNPASVAGGDFTDNLRVSYFVGLDCTQTRPRMLLSGDRNIYGPQTDARANGGYGNSPMTSTWDTSGRLVAMGTDATTLSNTVGWTDKIHLQQGNVAMADGSVQQFTSFYLVRALKESSDPGAGSPTTQNVILFP